MGSITVSESWRYLYRNLSDLGVDGIKEPREVSHDAVHQQLLQPACEPVGEKIHRPSLKQAGQQRDQRGSQKDDAAARHEASECCDGFTVAKVENVEGDGIYLTFQNGRGVEIEMLYNGRGIFSTDPYGVDGEGKRIM